MKKLAIIIALTMIQTQAFAAAETAVKSENAKPQVKTEKPATEQKQQVQTQKDEEYLLKYNIRDLEAAPWLHDGKRSYN